MHRQRLVYEVEMLEAGDGPRSPAVAPDGSRRRE